MDAVKLLRTAHGRKFLSGRVFAVGGFGVFGLLEENLHTVAVYGGIGVFDDDIAGEDIQIGITVKVRAVGNDGAGGTGNLADLLIFDDFAFAFDESFAGEAEQFDAFSGEDVIVLRQLRKFIGIGENEQTEDDTARDLGLLFVFRTECMPHLETEHRQKQGHGTEDADGDPDVRILPPEAILKCCFPGGG